MISFLSKGMARFLYKNKIVDEETSEVCRYGFEIIFSTALSLVLIVTIGILFDELLLSLLFYALFVGIRLFTGGYHAPTHFLCKALLVICCLFTIILTKFFLDYYSFTFHIVILFFFLITVFEFAPIVHENAPMDEEAKINNQRRSYYVSIIFVIITMFNYNWNVKISMLSALSGCIIAFLMLLSVIKERRNKNEQGNKKDPRF